MTVQQLANAAEAVIFANGEAIEIKRLCEVFVVKNNEMEKALQIIENRYNGENGGIRLLRLDKSVQFASAVEYGEHVRSALDLRRRVPLSPAGFEVLAVIAYNQPVTKSFIEQVRGVDCSGVISTLCEKELIEEKGRLELPGRPLLYGTTENFLRCFSLSSLNDLPPLPERDNLPEVQLQTEDASLTEEIETVNALEPAEGQIV